MCGFACNYCHKGVWLWGQNLVSFLRMLCKVPKGHWKVQCCCSEMVIFMLCGANFLLCSYSLLILQHLVAKAGTHF